MIIRARESLIIPEGGGPRGLSRDSEGNARQRIIIEISTPRGLTDLLPLVGVLDIEELVAATGDYQPRGH
jgi:hypothetical protein